MTNPIIQTDIADILKDLQKGQKEILEKVNRLEVGQARLEEKFEAQQGLIAELKGSQTKQIWTLIGLVCTAVVSLLIGLGKFIFFPNP